MRSGFILLSEDWMGGNAMGSGTHRVNLGMAVMPRMRVLYILCLHKFGAAKRKNLKAFIFVVE